jgi:serine O-acetyltransferase
MARAGGADDGHDRIGSREDLARFRRADAQAYGLDRTGPLLLARAPIIRFVWTLRLVEYTSACWRSPWGRAGSEALRYLLRNQGIRLGFTIHPHVFGPGLSIAHWGTIIVSPSARVGARCRIHADVNLGERPEAPVLGDDCYIGPGAKVYGGITIGHGCTIGANAVVNDSFPDDVVIAGVPARVIGESTRRTPEARDG